MKTIYSFLFLFSWAITFGQQKYGFEKITPITDVYKTNNYLNSNRIVVDDNNNVINAKNINNDTVSWLNYNSNESITYVPEGATRLLIQDWESQNIYEIKIVE